MGGLTGAVHWWEEWQLRVLVITSQLIQFFLYFFPYFRRRAIPGWFRFTLWLAYHAGDAVAIYALATLFNRHEADEGDGGRGGSSSNTMLLEVVWAPVLLIHLGGSDGVTAYNIEDNELWTRHLLTTVSQVTVAVYVFCKSWPPGGDKRLLQAAILLFIIGVVKCFVKAWAFKRASIYNLVSSAAATKQIKDGSMYNKLEKYVKDARDIVDGQQPGDHHQVMEDPGAAVMMTSQAQAQAQALSSVGSSNHHRSRLRRERAEARKKLRQQENERLSEEHGEASKQFVDLSSPYPRRIKIFEKFWGLSKERAYDSVQRGFASAFFLLYTKLKIVFPEDSYENTEHGSGSSAPEDSYKNTENESGLFIHLLRMALPWASIALFHHSHREAYNSIDVKITYALLCCTAVLEYYSIYVVAIMAVTKVDPRDDGLFRYWGVWPETVAQYRLVGYFVRNKKHNIKMQIVSLVGCKDFLDQLWCMEPCFSSASITHLILGYLKDGWKQKIQDAASYRSFNNHNNHWGLNMNRPFDECVLLWHLTTDFCFFSTSSQDHRCASVACSQESANCKAVRCRQMSNYMVYLLFVNPEMLLPGSRRNLFKTAYDELKGVLKDWEWNPVCWSRCTPCGVKQIKEEAIVMRKLIEVMQKKTKKRASQNESSKEATVTEIAITITQQKSERSSQEGSSMEGSNKEENFIDQAWALAQTLLEMDEMERWKEIQDVWVQMLCFSASRCRGYLHAKALGKGGEFLSYVWLLLFYMGMETFSERLQRELHPKELSLSHLSTINFGGLHQRRHSTSF